MLKGFIHSQVDIPYNYVGDTENINRFKEAFNILIRDLEKEYSLKNNINKSNFHKGLAKIAEANKKKTLEQTKRNLLESEKGYKDFSDEIIKIETEFNKKMDLLKEQDIYPDSASTRNPLSFSAGKSGFMSKIEIHQPFINSVIDSSLIIGRFKGNRQYNNYELISSIKYQFYYTDDLKPIWKKITGTEEISSEDIVEHCLSWLIERILEKK